MYFIVYKLMVYTCKQVPLSSYYALLYIKLKCIFKSIRNWEYNFFYCTCIHL